MMTTPELFANECATDYLKYRAKSTRHERGTVARKFYIQLAWSSRQYLRYWNVESSQ